jgi:hypothetical protein
MYSLHPIVLGKCTRKDEMARTGGTTEEAINVNNVE